MEARLVAIDSSGRVYIAVLISRVIVAIHVAIRISIAVERIRVAVEVRTRVTKAPLNSEYPKIFIIYPF